MPGYLDTVSSYVQLRKVGEDGTIRSDAAPGTEFVLVKKPKLPAGAANRLQHPRALVDEMLGKVRQQREVSTKQLREFASRYGSPQEKVKAYSEKLTPEEFQKRAAEFNTLVQKRFEDLSREIETRYEKLEEEFDSAVERIFGRQEKNAAAPSLEAKPAAPSTPTPTVAESHASIVTSERPPRTDAITPLDQGNGAKHHA